MAAITLTEFTDPACPFAYSAEPARLRIRWLYGEHIDWHVRMVGLADSPEVYTSVGFTPERQAEAHAEMAKTCGMPFDLTVRPRMSATIPACRAFVAARLHAPARSKFLLRAMRIRGMAGALFDDPAMIAAAAGDAGIDATDLERWTAEDETGAELEADMDAARHPSAAALALDHKLAGWSGGRRYTCPSVEIAREGSSATLSAPGMQPAAVYEALIANTDPQLPRRAAPESVTELLEWCDVSPATAEVAEVMGITIAQARHELAAVATLDPVGDDGFWRLTTT